MRRALAFTLLVLAACGNKDEPPKTVTVATFDAAAVALPAAPPAMPEDAGAPPAEAPLPSGDYEVTTEVVKDTCSPADAGASAPPTTTMFVHMKIWRDKSGREKVTGNFPLPMPAKGGFGGARSDIVLEPPAESTPASHHGLGSQCPAYELKTLHRVLGRTGDTVKVSYAREYGDASTCRSKAPSKCALDYVYTFRLVKKLCDPSCGVSFVKGADGGLGPKCDCPH